MDVLMVITVLKSGIISRMKPKYLNEFNNSFGDRFSKICDFLYNISSCSILQKRSIRLNSLKLYSSCVPKMIELTYRAGNIQYSLGLASERFDMEYVWIPEVLKIYENNFTYLTLYDKSDTFDEIYEAQGKEEKSGGNSVGFIERFSENYMMILFFKVMNGKGYLTDQKRIFGKDLFPLKKFQQYYIQSLKQCKLEDVKMKFLTSTFREDLKKAITTRITPDLEEFKVIVKKKKKKRKRKNSGTNGVSRTDGPLVKKVKVVCSRCQKEITKNRDGKLRKHRNEDNVECKRLFSHFYVKIFHVNFS